LAITIKHSRGFCAEYFQNILSFKRSLFIGVLFVWSLLLTQSVLAVNVEKLYEASVRAQLDRTEKQLTQDAFSQVLVKVSGRSDVLTSASYDELLKSADSAVSQFRYDYKSPKNAGLANADTKQEEKEKWFWVRFNANTVNRLLRDAHIPIWGKVRPETLLWFSREGIRSANKGQRVLVSQYDEPEIYKIFSRQAQARGISLLYPFLDLEDQANISANDLWGNFNDAVLLASRRYQAPATLTSRLFREPSGLWVSQWSLLMLGETQTWSIRDEKLERVLISGIDELADRLARQFTQVAQEGSNAHVLLQINNVSDFKEFQGVDDYLRHLATVKSLVLMQMEQDKLLYKIDYISSKRALIQEIRLGDVLHSIEQTHSNPEQGMAQDAQKAYKPVILDGLDKQSAIQNGASLETTAPNSLQAELEYWLAQ